MWKEDSETEMMVEEKKPTTPAVTHPSAEQALHFSDQTRTQCGMIVYISCLIKMRFCVQNMCERSQWGCTESKERMSDVE